MFVVGDFSGCSGANMRTKGHMNINSSGSVIPVRKDVNATENRTPPTCARFSLPRRLLPRLTNAGCLLVVATCAGEFRVRLRTLEDSLLDSLNAVKGNILDDETVR